jgi:RNA polymerase sigma-70 factor (ECF subfamily)
VEIVTLSNMGALMSRRDEMEPETLLAEAKAGSGFALGRLMERYRNYLALMARLQMGRLRGKLDVEDLLQEVSLEAHREIAKFRGQTEAEFLSWLRKVLSGIYANQLRHYLGTQRRDARREQRIAADLERSSRMVEGGLIAPLTSPSQQASKREQAMILADALEALPTTYREVIILRHLEGLSFPEVAKRMSRTEDSVKNHWARALARLRRTLESLR